jgi:hypothetical protein
MENNHTTGHNKLSYNLSKKMYCDHAQNECNKIKTTES